MKKLIVIIPAYNEEQSLPTVIREIPRTIPSIGSVKILVYDDGSRDGTVEAARKAGADYVISHRRNMGLAQTFKDAVASALSHGADIIVNTDADNQYNQREIPKLVKPLLEGRADMVIGDRQVAILPHMPLSKKYGNMLGSFLIRWLTGTRVTDASSGFRAFTRECVEKINIFSQHTYTHEMIIEAHYKNFIVINVPVEFRKRTAGYSRLISGGVLRHVAKSGATIIRTVLLYKAFSVLTGFGSLLIIGGLVGVGRFLYFALFLGQASGKIQSLILSSLLVAVGMTVLILGFIADLISYNRRLIEQLKK